MPVTLPSLEPIHAKPSPPSMLVWLGLLAVFMAAGAAYTLSTTPSDPHQRDHWFWFQLLGVPALTWCMTFGLRRHLHDTRGWLHEGEVAARAEDHDDAVAFGQDPLAVLGLACLSAFPEGEAARSLAAGGAPLASRETGSGGPPIRHSAIASGDGGVALVDRTRMVFERILIALDETLRSLPSEIPFDVRLRWPADADHEALMALWTRAWRDRDLPPAPTSRLTDDAGLMLLDAWLDHRDGPQLERFALIVAVQLHDDPPIDSAEAAVGLVLGWPPLAARVGLPIRAHVHRPVEAIGAEEFPDRLGEALLWGKLAASDVKEAWQSDTTGQDLFLKHAAGMGVLQSDELKAFHDIPAMLGDAGVAAEWFALAMAVERVSEARQAQMVVHGRGGERPIHRLATVPAIPSS